jgi:hypothetical protein
MLARFVPLEAISQDVVEMLDRIQEVAERAIPRT